MKSWMFPLDRNETTMMRGLAIVGIVLHNLLHWNKALFVPENEFSFDSTLPCRMLAELPDGFLQNVGNFFSFFGWYGVAVFVFLSGYGLVCKYEKGGAPLVPRKFLLRSVSKIYRLFVPAFIAFLIVDLVLSGMWTRTWSDLLVTGLLLNDPLVTWFEPVPGVFWYFGLTIELYVVYIVLRRFKSTGFWLAVACLLITATGNPAVWHGQTVLVWLKHNFFGWLPFFFFGMWWARKATGTACRDNGVGVVALVLVSAALVFACSFEFHAWIVSPFFAIGMTACIVRLLHRSPLATRVLVWLGGISSVMFAIHPTIRLVFIPIMREGEPLLWPLTLLYLLLAIASAYVWHRIAMRKRA